MKKILIGAVVVLVLGALWFASYRKGRGDKGTKVYAEEASRRDLGRVVKASGEIEPRVKVNISAHVVGKIERIYVKEGGAIRKGQPFIELEKEAYIASRDQLAAQLRRAQNDIRQAEVTLADTRQKLSRARRLNEERIFATDRLEDAALAEATARLRLEDAREGVRQTQATLEKARDDLAKTTIYAPLTGRVVRLNAEEGEVVVSGTMNNAGSVIAEIADLSEILANVDVDETEVVLIRPGQPAVIRVDAIPNREYHGRVIEVGSSGFSRPQQPDVTFFKVEILLDDPDDALRPVMSLRAEIETATRSKVLVVPIQAVVERDEKKKDAADGDRDEDAGKVVFVVENGVARARPVTTGISDETRVEIVSGLKGGEKVVTGPYRSLRDLKEGDAVQITTPEQERKASGRKADNEDDEDGEGEERENN